MYIFLVQPVYCHAVAYLFMILLPKNRLVRVYIVCQSMVKPHSSNLQFIGCLKYLDVYVTLTADSLSLNRSYLLQVPLLSISCLSMISSLRAHTLGDKCLSLNHSRSHLMTYVTRSSQHLQTQQPSLAQLPSNQLSKKS